MNQISDDHFNEHKQQALKKLEKAIHNKKVDSKILPILYSINDSNEFFTTSSCAGRIIVLQLPEIGDKKQAVFLGRWHRTVSEDEVVSALDQYMSGQIWLLAQPPIFHIGCKTLENANLLMKTGIMSGFKHSGIRSISGQIIVELQSTERMDIPLGYNGKQVIPNSHILFFIETANRAIIKAQKKLDRLEENIKKMKNK
jgi:tRNA wybutosine-synthesizing protein 3